MAGKVAGNKSIGSKSDRIGFVGSFITPETVRHAAAFFLGARSVDADVKLEVQWMGFWSDLSSGPQFRYREGTEQERSYFYEEYIARYLIDHGAVVVAHASDNQRVVKLVQTLTEAGAFEGKEQVYSISNDNPLAYRALVAQPSGGLATTGDPLPSCLGSPYWYWTPIYTDIFREMHAGTWLPSNRNVPLSADPERSPVGFNLNPVVGIDDSVVRGFLNETATRGWQDIYRGPYKTTGQRDKDGDGQVDATQEVAANDTLSDDEYTRMCWFPEGIIERFPFESDDPAHDRPALVPDASFETSPEYEQKRADMLRAAFPGVSLDCNKNR